MNPKATHKLKNGHKSKNAHHKNAAHHDSHKSETKSKIHNPSKASGVIHKKTHSSRFCPKCGNPLDTKDATFCKSCKTVDFEFKDLILCFCQKCGNVNHKNKWHHYKDMNHAMMHIMKDKVKAKITHASIQDLEKIESYKAGVDKEITISVEIKGEMFDLPGRVQVTLCDKCGKQGSQYFEGIVQLRNSNKRVNDFFRKEVAKNKSKGVHINKEVLLDKYSDENIDFYVTNKKFAAVIAEKLRKEFGAVIKKNAQLFSINWETSQNLYRMNVLVQIPKYMKNDVIRKDGNLYKIVSMDANIHVTNLKNNSKTLLPHKDYDVLKPVEVLIIKKYPEFEIMDPNTYYQARLMNPEEKLEVNSTIRVIIDAGEAWMV